MLSLHDRPRPSHPALAWRQVVDDVVVVDPTREETCVRILNPIGGAIWLLLDGTHSLGDIAATLFETYEAPLSTLEDDVVAFVEALQDRGLVAV